MNHQFDARMQHGLRGRRQRFEIGRLGHGQHVAKVSFSQVQNRYGIAVMGKILWCDQFVHFAQVAEGQVRVGSLFLMASLPMVTLGQHQTTE